MPHAAGGGVVAMHGDFSPHHGVCIFRQIAFEDDNTLGVVRADEKLQRLASFPFARDYFQSRRNRWDANGVGRFECTFVDTVFTGWPLGRANGGEHVGDKIRSFTFGVHAGKGGARKISRGHHVLHHISSLFQFWRFAGIASRQQRSYAKRKGKA